MEKKIKLGIIACSMRIRAILDNLPELGSRIEITALCDLDPDRVKNFQDRYNVHDAKVYQSYEEMLETPELDWVAISPYNALHAPMAVKAINAGKHVFCEKPIATTLEDATKLYKALINHPQQKFIIGFTLRYSKFYRKLKELLSAGTIGKIISMELNETLAFNHGGHICSCWRRLEEFTGSHLLEKCCHDIDLANWLTGSQPKYIASFGGLDFFIPKNAEIPNTLMKSKDGHKAYSSWPTAQNKNPFLTDKDIVDNQVAIIEYLNGVRATFHTNLNAGIPERRFYILGEKGALRGDLNKFMIEQQNIGFDEPLKEVFHEDQDDFGHFGADDEIRNHWTQVMLNDGLAPLSDMKDGFEAAITCFAAEEARKKMKVVDVDGYRNKLYGVSEFTKESR